MTSLDKFLRKYIFRIIGSTLGVLFHLFVIVKAVNEGGEGGGWAILILDFPIIFLSQLFMERGQFIWGPTLYLLGTLMYALLGWLIGWPVDWKRRMLQKG